MLQEAWVGAIHRVLYEVSVLVNRFCVPKQGLTVSIDNFVTQWCTLMTREAFKHPCEVCD